LKVFSPENLAELGVEPFPNLKHFVDDFSYFSDVSEAESHQKGCIEKDEIRPGDILIKQFSFHNKMGRSMVQPCDWQDKITKSKTVRRHYICALFGRPTRDLDGPWPGVYSMMGLLASTGRSSRIQINNGTKSTLGLDQSHRATLYSKRVVFWSIFRHKSLRNTKVSMTHYKKPRLSLTFRCLFHTI
jgi:hypothetical protein